jgi:RNA polymerase sigma-70 factor (ECF subfamily)
LIALARKKLKSKILRKEDPDDAVQSAFRSFFHRHRLGQFRIGSRDDLWALLVRMTLYKCGHRIEYYHAAMRDVIREAEAPEPSGSSDFRWEALSREPPPDEAAMLNETLERLLSSLKPHQRQIVLLSMEERSTAEIAGMVCVTQKAVQRVLKGVRERLERWIAAAKNEPSPSSVCP